MEAQLTITSNADSEAEAALAAKMAEAFPAQHRNEVAQWVAIAEGKVLYLKRFPDTAKGRSQGRGSQEHHGKLSPETGPSPERYSEFVARQANAAGYRRGYSRTQVDAMIHRVENYDRQLLDNLTRVPLPRGIGAFIDSQVALMKDGGEVLPHEELSQHLEQWLVDSHAPRSAAPEPTEKWETALASIRRTMEKLGERDRKLLVPKLLEYIEQL